MKANDITATIDKALRSAGLDSATPLVTGIRRHIHNAMVSAGLARAGAEPKGDGDGDVIDIEAHERPEVHEVARDVGSRPAPIDTGPGRFTWHRHDGAAGSRRFKTYVPVSCRGRTVPLLVMLHGCRQDADDFAAGTCMNRLADDHGFIVAYPQQPARANGSTCWNWFEPRDQRRDGGEPQIIAGIVQQLVAQGQVDGTRVFVAGLSAGAAMALILAHTHPEMFAGIGVHSGLPYAAARDVGSAFAAMAGGSARRVTSSQVPLRVPTIVFHGDSDSTVNVINADAIVAAVRQGFESADGRGLQDAMAVRGTAGGRAFVRTTHADDGGRVWLEDWRIDGAGHAWSGGSAEGSFADEQGPDASAAMVEFFFSQPVARNAP